MNVVAIEISALECDFEVVETVDIAHGPSLLPLILISHHGRNPNTINSKSLLSSKIVGSSLLLEGLNHDQIVSVLDDSVLDILHRLEEWSCPPVKLPLLLLSQSMINLMSVLDELSSLSEATHIVHGN